jgi:hypothetical protein
MARRVLSELAGGIGMGWTTTFTKYSLFVLAATGCMAEVQGSRGLLGPERSRAEIALPPHDAGQQVVRLLASRGYALVDQRPTGAGLMMQFKGDREPYIGGSKTVVATTAIGSEFDVRIDPGLAGHSVVTIDGVPIIDGRTVCPAAHTYSCATTRAPIG